MHHSCLRHARWLRGLVLAVLWFVPAVVDAQRAVRRAELLLRGDERCVSAESLRGRLASPTWRLVDAPEASAELALSADVQRRTADDLSVVLEVRWPDGHSAQRSLAAQSCEAALGALALLIQMTFDAADRARQQPSTVGRSGAQPSAAAKQKVDSRNPTKGAASARARAGSGAEQRNDGSNRRAGAGGESRVAGSGVDRRAGGEQNNDGSNRGAGAGGESRVAGSGVDRRADGEQSNEGSNRRAGAGGESRVDGSGVDRRAGGEPRADGRGGDAPADSDLAAEGGGPGASGFSEAAAPPGGGAGPSDPAGALRDEDPGVRAGDEAHNAWSSVVQVVLGAQLGLASGAAPGLQPGVGLFGALALRGAGVFMPWLQLELAHAWRSGLSLSGGHADFALDGGQVLACPVGVHLRPLAAHGCGALELARLRARGYDTYEPRTLSRAWASVGAGLLLRASVLSQLELQLAAALLHPLWRDQFSFAPDVFYAVPSWRWQLKVGVAVRFL